MNFLDMLEKNTGKSKAYRIYFKDSFDRYSFIVGMIPDLITTFLNKKIHGCLDTGALESLRYYLSLEFGFYPVNESETIFKNGGEEEIAFVELPEEEEIAWGIYEKPDKNKLITFLEFINIDDLLFENKPQVTYSTWYRHEPLFDILLHKLSYFKLYFEHQEEKDTYTNLHFQRTLKNVIRENEETAQYLRSFTDDFFHNLLYFSEIKKHSYFYPELELSINTIYVSNKEVFYDNLRKLISDLQKVYFETIKRLTHNKYKDIHIPFLIEE